MYLGLFYFDRQREKKIEKLEFDMNAIFENLLTEVNDRGNGVMCVTTWAINVGSRTSRIIYNRNTPKVLTPQFLVVHLFLHILEIILNSTNVPNMVFKIIFKRTLKTKQKKENIKFAIISI